jgi:phage I-like protein
MKHKPKKTRPVLFGESAEVGDGTSRVLLLREGLNIFKKGGEIIRLWFDSKSFDSIMEETRLRRVDIPCDYEHQSEAPPQSRPNGPVPSAGWIDYKAGLEWEKGVGLFATVKWTDKALEMIRSGEYRYYSPALNFDPDSGRVTAITSLALTNRPATLNQKAIAADANGDVNMNPEILAALGLEADADDAAILAAIEALKKAAEAGMADKQAAEEKAAADAAAKAAASAAAMSAKGEADETKKQVAELTAKLNASDERWRKRDEDDFIAEGMKAGKIVAANEAMFRTTFKASGADEARKLLASAPPVVNMNRVTGGGSGNATSSDRFATMSTDEERNARYLEIDAYAKQKNIPFAQAVNECPV